MDKMKKLQLASAITALFLSANANAAVINVFSDEASWLAAVGSYVTEDFEDLSLQTPFTNYLSFNGSITGGVWDDIINMDEQLATAFNFAPGVYGIGGTWDLAGPGGPGSGIQVTTLNSTYAIDVIPGTTAGFWGFTIDESVSTMIMSEGTGSGYQETFTLDNMQMATTLVPVPAAVWLFGSGLVGLVGVARRKKV